VEEELGKLPTDLATTYDQIYKRIQDDVHSEPLALKALMWILGAEKPLSPDEWAGGVSWALPRSNGKSPKLKTSMLLDVCENLVVHDGHRNVMRFAHLSVREFLETKALDRQAAEMAACACLAILQHPHILNAQPTASTDFTPFHQYSIRYWPEHVLRCDDNDPTPQLSSALSAFMGSFICPADAYIHWFRAATSMHVYSVRFQITKKRLWSTPPNPHFAAASMHVYDFRLKSTPPNPLLAAAYFGFKKVCSHLWEPNTFNPNFTNDGQETLLYLASSQGHIATVRLLLQNGAEVNHVTHGGKKAPLLAAIKGHYSKILDLLLEAGAIFNNTKYGSIELSGASVGNGAVMQLLLQRDATIEITEAIVTAAAGNRFSGKKVMELLLQRDATIEITEAIVTAAAGNCDSGEKVMELLLQRDATIEITETIVTAAAGNCDSGKEVMELLLQRDGTIEVTEAIVTAAAGNRSSGKEVMELLLQRDVTIEITQTIVTAAARNRFSGKKVMKLLLQTARAFATKSSLIAAAFFAQHHWFETLCSKINDNSLAPQNDIQCLIAAIEGGNPSILDDCLLFSHGSGDTDDHGWTLHMVAMQSRNQKAIEKLQDSSEKLMQPISVTHWEVNPIISPFVSIDGDGTSLVYSGNLPGYTAEFQVLTINR
jgi:hypothetical protein